MYVVICRKKRSAFREYKWYLACTRIFTRHKAAKSWWHSLQNADATKEFAVSRAEITVLQTSTAGAHLKAIDRAIAIVESWPGWKRNVEIFRGVRRVEDNHE